MIKQLSKSDVQNTPFIANTSWNLLNTSTEALLALDIPGDPDATLAIDFVDYSTSTPFGLLNSGCSIALEQQADDTVVYEEGISGSGFFASTDPKNPTGTYKRLVYQWILKSFYNSYRNPLAMFGVETWDFQTSGVQRYLSDEFKIFRIPKNQLGEKMAPGSVMFVDDTLDDVYIVADDGNCNLVASPNLFSRVQEIRKITNSEYVPWEQITTPWGNISLNWEDL